MVVVILLSADLHNFGLPTFVLCLNHRLRMSACILNILVGHCFLGIKSTDNKLKARSVANENFYLKCVYVHISVLQRVWNFTNFDYYLHCTAARDILTAHQLVTFRLYFSNQ